MVTAILNQVANAKFTEERMMDEMPEGAGGGSSTALMEGRQRTERESPMVRMHSLQPRKNKEAGWWEEIKQACGGEPEEAWLWGPWGVECKALLHSEDVAFSSK